MGFEEGMTLTDIATALENIAHHLETIAGRTSEEPERMMDDSEVAKLLSCHPKTVGRLRLSGRIGFVRIGNSSDGQPRIPVSEYNRFIRDNIEAGEIQE